MDATQSAPTTERKPARTSRASNNGNGAAPSNVVSMPAKVPSTFERLAAVNVNAHVEKKNGMSYLSWAWAWDYLLREDPSANFGYGEPRTFGGDTMMVFCTVTAFGVSKTAHLPVMDNRNRPIEVPDAFQINTAMQRALVKAIALHGLGLYLYAGEDLPTTEAASEEPKAAKPVAAPAGYDKVVKGAEEAAKQGTEFLKAYARTVSRDCWTHLVERDHKVYELIKGAAIDVDAKKAAKTAPEQQ